MRKDLTKEKVCNTCLNSLSMAKASVELKTHINTLRRLATKFGCYKPNQSLKGGNKNKPTKIPLNEILEGLHPSFNTYKLKLRLLKEGVMENKCSFCDINSWMGKEIMIELDHIDGNSNNHKLCNLRMLCPNCHSQTSTFRSRNIRKI